MDRVLRPTTAPPPRKAVSLKQVQHMVRQGKARGAAAPSNHDTNPHAHLREVDSLLNNGIVGEAPQQADPRSSSVFGSGRRHAYALETSHETPYGLDSDIKAQREAELEAYKQQAPHRVSTPFAVHEADKDDPARVAQEQAFAHKKGPTQYHHGGAGAGAAGAQPPYGVARGENGQPLKTQWVEKPSPLEEYKEKKKELQKKAHSLSAAGLKSEDLIPKGFKATDERDPVLFTPQYEMQATGHNREARLARNAGENPILRGMQEPERPHRRFHRAPDNNPITASQSELATAAAHRPMRRIVQRSPARPQSARVRGSKPALDPTAAGVRTVAAEAEPEAKDPPPPSDRNPILQNTSDYDQPSTARRIHARNNMLAQSTPRGIISSLSSQPDLPPPEARQQTRKHVKAEERTRSDIFNTGPAPVDIHHRRPDTARFRSDKVFMYDNSGGICPPRVTSDKSAERAAYERSLAEFHAQKSTHERDRAQTRARVDRPTQLW